jgi:hypothetical protein
MNEALQHISSAVQLDPTNASLTNNKAVIQLFSGKMNEVSERKVEGGSSCRVSGEKVSLLIVIQTRWK